MIDIRINEDFNKLTPIRGAIFVTNFEVGEHQIGHIKMQYEAYKRGKWVHPRWAQICAVSNGEQNFKVGQWVLLRHGHWSTVMKMKRGEENFDCWYILPKHVREGILVVSDEKPSVMYEYDVKDFV